LCTRCARCKWIPIRQGASSALVDGLESGQGNAQQPKLEGVYAMRERVNAVITF
jgi:hypothetical protein